MIGKPVHKVLPNVNKWKVPARKQIDIYPFNCPANVCGSSVTLLLTKLVIHGHLSQTNTYHVTWWNIHYFWLTAVVERNSHFFCTNHMAAHTYIKQCGVECMASNWRFMSDFLCTCWQKKKQQKSQIVSVCKQLRKTLLLLQKKHLQSGLIDSYSHLC